MKRNAAVKAALEHYRGAASPGASTRERMLRGLTQRVANGESPSVHVLSSLRPLVTPATTTLVHRPLRVAVAAASCTVALVLAGFWPAREQRVTRASLPQGRASTQLTAPAPGAQALEDQAAFEPAVQSVAAPVHDLPPATPSERVRSREIGVDRATRTKAAATRSVRRDAAQTARESAVSTSETTTPKPDGQTAKRRDLEEELRLVREAYAALRARQPERALARLAEHASRFPTGELAESRQVARIMALCQAGEVAPARAEAAQFLKSSANSPYAARVRSLCGGVPQVRSTDSDRSTH